MRKPSSFGARCVWFGLLWGAAMAASAAGPKQGAAAPADGAATAVQAPAPATRLIVRYKTGVKMAGQGGVTAATERHEAALRVARTAQLSGLAQLQYVQSVSPHLHVVTLPGQWSAGEARAAMQQLRSDAGVADVMIDHRMKPHRVPNDPLFGSGVQWHLLDGAAVPGGINAAAAWGTGSGAGVVVAVLDGGYRPHADLAANVLPGYDFVSADGSGFPPFWTANDGDGRDPDAQDPGDWVTPADVTAGFCDLAEPSSWHGTHVAGIVAALGDNGLDGLGGAYGARILPVRVLGRCGGFASDILAGARWAAGLQVPGVPDNPHPARILNLSLGSEGQVCSPATQSVMDEIRSRNVSIVASSGNDSSTVISMPANCSGVVAVTAHTRDGDNAFYANVGPGVAISAPGGGENTVFSNVAAPPAIWSTWNLGQNVPGADGMEPKRGTSMAAPQVAGVLALLAAARPDLTMAELENIMTRAVRPFPPGSYCATNPQNLAPGFCGSGLLDAGLAVSAALHHVAPAPAPASGGGGGGGCTVAPPGQTDAGLTLLALVAAGVLIWRRRWPGSAP